MFIMALHSRRTMSISGLSINRFHVVHAYRWNTKLPMVATCVRALPCLAVPRPCPSGPRACKRVRARADVCDAMRLDRYSTWTAVSFGISALPALRTALLRPLTATRCADRCTAWAHPPRGLNGLTPRQICTGDRAHPYHFFSGIKRAHPVICARERARPVPNLHGD